MKNYYINQFKGMTLGIIILFFLVGFVSALDSQGTGIEGQNFTFVQTCDDATWITISTIQFPNRSVESIETNMSSLGGGAFQYNFTNIINGRHDVTGISDGCTKTFSTYFEVTDSGSKQTTAEGLGSSIYLILILALITMFSYMGFKLVNSDELWVFGVFLIFIALILVVYAAYLNMFYYSFFIGSLNTSSLPSVLFVFLLFCVVISLMVAGLLLFKKIPMIIGKLFKGTLDKEDGWDRNAFN